MVTAAAQPLDLFSTSQTNRGAIVPEGGLSVAGKRSDPAPVCINNAPFVAFQIDEATRRWGVVQGNCNSWTCPRCGEMRAKAEYGRIVEGARQLHEEYGQLLFVTLTCRGADMPLADAQRDYLKWTNRLLTAARTRAKRAGQPWHYAQVTERQKRGHPHSHILTTWDPGDLYEGYVMKWNKQARRMEPEPALRSDWLQKASVRAGLGEQYDVSVVKDPEAASRYVAKYMFKESMFADHWPKNWKRVRYSQNWPRLEHERGPAMALLSRQDWLRLASEAALVEPKDPTAREAAEVMLRNSLTRIRKPLSQEDILRIATL